MAKPTPRTVPAAAPKATGGKPKTVCPVSLEDFAASAEPLTVSIGGQLMVANVKAPFSTGSFGWNSTGKIVIDVGGVPVSVQVGINLIAVGSKPEA